MVSIRSKLIVRDREIMSGTPVFAGTRVPVRTLTDYLAAGHSLEEFLDQFPSVSREQAAAVLELMTEVLLAGIHESTPHRTEDPSPTRP